MQCAELCCGLHCAQLPEPCLLLLLLLLLQENAVNNVGLSLWEPLEVVLLLTWHLAREVSATGGGGGCWGWGGLLRRCSLHLNTIRDINLRFRLLLVHPRLAVRQMLYRGIVLTAATGWTIDRLYEAGAEDSLGPAGAGLGLGGVLGLIPLGAHLHLGLATPQAGAVLAAVGCAAISLALLVQVGGGHALLAVLPSIPRSQTDLPSFTHSQTYPPPSFIQYHSSCCGFCCCRGTCSH